ncbi:ketopantoate reductase [Streptomyces sp. V3I7]|nr:2-dehydropantoate 2-reductase N-terminal domain-containing protein [Streptomyces sp. V3I7]MDQ0993700.1 ketopantoate reductase [Streptomyces sp. V3I7]
MRYIIIGAGAVGGTVGGRLAQAGREVVLLGRLRGVPTPLNALLQRLANHFAREHRPAGSLPADELMRLADAEADH